MGEEGGRTFPFAQVGEEGQGMNRLLEAHEHLQQVEKERRTALHEAVEERRAAIREASEQGMTHHAIAEMLGITRVRVGQILKDR
jgi:DNA-directed RNA polymerase specialized sigma subunit